MLFLATPHLDYQITTHRFLITVSSQLLLESHGPLGIDQTLLVEFEMCQRMGETARIMFTSSIPASMAFRSAPMQR
jgi:hypothetical protein